jgi:hypothetical protein
MKQFLVIKVEKDFKDKVAEWTPLPGMFSKEAAERLIEQAMMRDPNQTLLMQEVGRA